MAISRRPPIQVVQHEVIVMHLTHPATNGANVRTIGTNGL